MRVKMPSSTIRSTRWHACLRGTSRRRYHANGPHVPPPTVTTPNMIVRQETGQRGERYGLHLLRWAASMGKVEWKSADLHRPQPGRSAMLRRRSGDPAAFHTHRRRRPTGRSSTPWNWYAAALRRSDRRMKIAGDWNYFVLDDLGFGTPKPYTAVGGNGAARLRMSPWLLGPDRYCEDKVRRRDQLVRRNRHRGAFGYLAGGTLGGTSTATAQTGWRCSRGSTLDRVATWLAPSSSRRTVWCSGDDRARST